MLQYLITCVAPDLKLIEYARTWREAQTLADAWVNEHAKCTVTIAEILSTQTKGYKR